MSIVTSKDGTRIAYQKSGMGPPLILVDGALCSRTMGPMPKLTPLLTPHFTVFMYDRRGRGESGNTLPWAMEREIEDIDALLTEAGGSAHLFGISSGGALSLAAAKRLPGITRIAVYEAPFIIDDTHAPMPDDFLPRMRAAVAEERRGDAVAMFMKIVGMPAFMTIVMRMMPVWKKLTAVAHTLVYDISMIREFQRGKPFAAGQWAGVTMPALVLDGGKSPTYMRNGMRALANALPDARYETLAGQTHMVKESVLAPVLSKFLGG